MSAEDKHEAQESSEACCLILVIWSLFSCCELVYMCSQTSEFNITSFYVHFFSQYPAIEQTVEVITAPRLKCKDSDTHKKGGKHFSPPLLIMQSSKPWGIFSNLSISCARCSKRL